MLSSTNKISMLPACATKSILHIRVSLYVPIAVYKPLQQSGSFYRCKDWQPLVIDHAATNPHALLRRSIEADRICSRRWNIVASSKGLESRQFEHGPEQKKGTRNYVFSWSKTIRVMYG